MSVMVLIIGPDDRSNSQISLQLQMEGYAVGTAVTEQAVLRKLHAELPAVLILDVSITKADMNGWRLCQDIRAFSNLPIIMISDSDDEADRAKALELEVDGYLVKPFDRKALVAEIEAALRKPEASMVEKGVVLRVDENLMINLCARRIKVRGQSIALTSKEFELLSCLARNAGRLFTSEELLELVWDGKKANRTALKAYIWRLRQKIEENPRKPQYILTRRGIGYFFKQLS